MKLFQFNHNQEIKLGLVLDEKHLDLTAILQTIPNNELPQTLAEYMAAGETAIQSLSTYIAGLKETKPFELNETKINWAPAIHNPEKILCVGLNYKKHADETKSPYPKEPVIFSKFNNALAGHMETVKIPATTKRLDHEVELGIVIGTPCFNVSEKGAIDHVFGYVTANDLSARDTQKQSSQWLLGKSSDGFAPVGPYLVTKDEVPNPDNLRLTTTVAGEVRQDSNTKDMIFSCAEIVSYVSRYMTLKPGDLILTGTPEGVIIGKQPRESRVYLAPGDQVTVQVEGLGALTTKFI